MLDSPLISFEPTESTRESNTGRNTDLYTGHSVVVYLKCNSSTVLFTGTVQLTLLRSVISDPDDVRIYYQGDFRDHDRIENLGFGDYMKE